MGQASPSAMRSKSKRRADPAPLNDQNGNVPKANANHQDAPAKKGKTLCAACKKKCSGEVLRVQERYFHTECFRCRACSQSLAHGGFFQRDGAYYCTSDYQRHYGTKCATCSDYVEGEVVTALGKTYHQKCFTCGRCRQPFPAGERVTYTGKEVLCQKCVQIPVRGNSPSSPATAATSPTDGTNVEQLSCSSYDLYSANAPAAPVDRHLFAECAGCKEELKEGQALIALDRQWHVWCFKCGACGAVLHGEYMGKDGAPYCERDYQKRFGVKCAYCTRYISGKVLQAGDNHHFHPTCARCTKCGDPFGDGEEMYLQGGAIWHPRCGPGPTENGTVLNGPADTNGHCTDTESRGYTSGREFDRMSSSGVSELQFSLRSRSPSLRSLCSPPSRRSNKHSYRTPSPGLMLREYKSAAEDVSRIYTYSYLTEEPTQGYLRRPIDPYDRAPMSPHFHRPSSQHSMRGSQSAGGRFSFKQGSKSGMRVMVDSMRSETPRPKSPGMNNEEPIELAHFPDAKKPRPGEQPKIERDDFPAPPYPYTDPERRRRWSDTYKGVPDSEEDEADGALSPQEIEDLQLKREEQELSKIATGIGKVFLKNVKEREKIKKWKAAHLDPRNASRTPSASKEPAYRLRYESPVGASPSRNTDHPKPFEEDEYDRSVSCRSTSLGRTSAQNVPSYNVVSSRRSVPRPGYGLQSATLPASLRNGLNGYHADYSFSGLGDKTHSTDFSSGKSDISTGSNTDADRRAMNSDAMPVSTTYTGGLTSSGLRGYVTHMRRSLPNMAHTALINEPAKIYPYHLLLITNYRLPQDVDRCNLERHLSDVEFEAIFQCQRGDFYRMPQWRRNELKRRARLF